ncbi:hypothetical protein E2C01_100138 [Portunus trituberculatus]|uniref:Transmembrane protein n=1 Tax=Portunus trituberculatus TaxID=210409 RepID=A0A5B7KCR9_PORTR|nr:hypothetical protein [Portunus trituberculatus]
MKDKARASRRDVPRDGNGDERSWRFLLMGADGRRTRSDRGVDKETVVRQRYKKPLAPRPYITPTFFHLRVLISFICSFLFIFLLLRCFILPISISLLGSHNDPLIDLKVTSLYGQEFTIVLRILMILQMGESVESVI